MSGERNHQLEQLISETGVSHRMLARAVREMALSEGRHSSADHTSVTRWLAGGIPRNETPAYIARFFSAKLGRTLTLADIGMARDDDMSPELGLVYADDEDDAVKTLSRLWRADLSNGASAIRTAAADQAWREASLRWLVGTRGRPRSEGTSGRRVGLGDVEAVRTTVDHYAQLDNRFGGGHGRRALIQFLSDDVEPLLQGQFTSTTGDALFSAVAEATLLAAWMSYDSGVHGLAQRYFIQAMRLAEAGSDRRLAGSVLSAMSHQATFLGRFKEAAEMARAGIAGIRGVGTATLRAQFHAMEARALARLGDARACDLAIGDALTEFEQRQVDDDPLWIRYFDSGELGAEIIHCERDLGRPARAITYGFEALGHADGQFLRSDFFASMVLADAHAAAGHVEEACRIANQMLSTSEQLRSTRCATYVSEFGRRVSCFGHMAVVRGFLDSAAGHPLWHAAS